MAECPCHGSVKRKTGMSLLSANVFGLCVYPQERRRAFEANLEKRGLELETEDKSVRNSTV